jgi:hypothetical protein
MRATIITNGTIVFLLSPKMRTTPRDIFWFFQATNKLLQKFTGTGKGKSKTIISFGEKVLFEA